MRYILAFAALSSALFGQNGTTSHDDPIIISRGSVYVNFGTRTRAIQKAQWAKKTTVKSQTRYLYNQHAHMASDTTRDIQSFFYDGKPSTDPASKSQNKRTLSPTEQQNTRIEVFLTGKNKKTGKVESIGAIPQLILSAVKVSTACCMHPLVNGANVMPPNACEQQPNHGDSLESRTYPFSWQLSSDAQLLDVGKIAEPKRGAPLLRMQYKNDKYDDITIDYWNVYDLTRGEKPVYSSAPLNSTGKRINAVRGCPLIEVCANEKGSNNSGAGCITEPFECRLKADPLPGGGPVSNKP